MRETAIGIAAILIAGPVIFGFVYQGRYNNAARQNAAEFATYTNQEVGEACREIAAVELVHCFSDARIKSELKNREYQHEQADLVAQQIGALWTNLMGIAALLGVGLSVVGVYLVWTTFRETRKANLIAIADRRPSLHPDNVKFQFLDENSLRVEIPIKNFGQSYADKVALTSAIAFGPYPLPKFPPPITEFAAPTGKMAPGATRYQYVERQDLAERKAAVLAGSQAFLVYAHVSYSDQFGETYSDRFDFFCAGNDFAAGLLRVCEQWQSEEPDVDEPNPPQGTLNL